MRKHSESNTYNVTITLATEDGELPTEAEVERLIADQMAGDLDEYTGLRCINVNLNKGENR